MKFFRKFRQQVINDRKLADYLFYAIGEIILVVIGILIALAINNSSGERAEREKEQMYLRGLKQEFEISRMKLEELIKINDENLEGARKIVAHMSEDQTTLNEVQFSELLYRTFALDIGFNPNNSLLEEMVNSGSLKSLSNGKLRIQLTNWLSTLEDIGKQERDLAIQREKVLDIFREQNYSIRTILEQVGMSSELNLIQSGHLISNLELLKSVEFENNVLIFILTSYATGQAHYAPLLADINTILDYLDSEIK